MMKQWFDIPIDRRVTNSMKWDVGADELPMWVADMDFQTAPAVSEALEAIVQRGIYGYAQVTEAWRDAVSAWWRDRHGLDVRKEWLIFTTGVVAAVSVSVKRLTRVGDSVAVLTPVYDIFFNSIVNHGRHVLESELGYEEGAYRIDFDDLEKKLAHPLTTLLILCNPHNPVGKVWSREDLDRIGQLCARHHVTVVSDEIHCDLTEPGIGYVPFASVSEQCADLSVTLVSASKAFNLAGLQSAAVIVPNEALRQIMERGLNADEVAEPNAFAMDATVAAFARSGEWLDGLRDYLACNKRNADVFLAKQLPQILRVPSDATYLLWLDVGAITEDAAMLCDFLRRETGLILSAGNKYRGNGKRFLRMNIACPAVVLEDGLHRLKAGIQAYEKR